VLNGFLTAAGVRARIGDGGLTVHRRRVRGPRDGEAAWRRHPLTPVSSRSAPRHANAARQSVRSAGVQRARPVGESPARAKTRFDHFGYTEDPKIHDLALGIQKDVLNHLLHPAGAEAAHGTRGCTATNTRGQALVDLTMACSQPISIRNVNTFRQNLQVEYVERLLKIAQPGDGTNTTTLRRAWRSIACAGSRSKSRASAAATSRRRRIASNVRYLIQHALDEPKA